MENEIMFTQEQVNAMIQSESDKRVTGALKTQQEKFEAQKQIDLELAKANWQKEFEANAKLTAEEKAKKALEDRENEISKRESDLFKRTNKLTAKETLSNANVPSSYYNDFLDMLVTADEKVTEANIDKFIKSYNAVRTDIETNIKSQLTKVPAPASGGTNETMTKEKFDKMSYAEMVKFKGEHPEEFNKYR